MKKILINIFYKPISIFLQNMFRTRFQTDMYITQTQIVERVHEQTFTKYKNLYNGEDIAIIATGPSLNKYKPIANTINIGVNGAIKSSIPLDYFFSIDADGINKVIDVIEKKDNVQKFYGVLPEHPYGLKESNTQNIISESLILKHNAKKFFVYLKRPNLPVHFNTEIDKTWLVDGGSSTFSAVQFALFTNPKRIYLVGCDCSSGYFDGKGKNDASPFIKVWKELKKFADIYYPETEIISVNPVGLKGLFTDLYQEDND